MMGESLWKYLERFKDLLLQCQHHGVEIWRLPQIVFDSLNYPTRAMVQSMCGGDFKSKTTEEAWVFLGDVTEKSMECETLREPERPTPTRGIHALSGTYETDAKMTIILKRLEAL